MQKGCGRRSSLSPRGRECRAHTNSCRTLPRSKGPSQATPRRPPADMTSRPMCPESEVRLHSSAAASTLTALLLRKIAVLFLVVAPCHRGASALSVMNELLTQDTRRASHIFIQTSTEKIFAKALSDAANGSDHPSPLPPGGTVYPPSIPIDLGESLPAEAKLPRIVVAISFLDGPGRARRLSPRCGIG